MTKNLDIYANAKYMGKAEVPHEILVEGQEEPNMVLEESNSYIVSNVYLNYQLSFLKDFNCKVSLGVKNILDAYQNNLDKGPGRDPAFLYGPSQPRTINFGLEISF